MHELKLIIVPSETRTRMCGQDADGTTRLKAWLPSAPPQAEALPTLLDALGRFLPVRA